jgi:dTDP-4-amino-4,6-dideoxygalactose transaminase
MHNNHRVPLVDLKAQYSTIQQEIHASINEVLASCQFVGGPYVERFEQEFAHYVGARYAVGVSSGTAALELALKAAGIGNGDEVIVPANTFVATAEAVSNVGATAVFADVEPATFHLDAVSVRAAITPRTRAVIPVHLYGRAMDLREIEEVASAHSLFIIEDAAQAHGAQRNGKRVGSSGRPACFSFYPGKNLGAYGDAGAVTCGESWFAERLRLLRDHGSPRKYQHSIIGTNSRLDALQAAVLSVKLRHLEDWNAQRRRHARAYTAALSGSPICTPEANSEEEHVWHLFVVRVQQRDALRQYLSECGVETVVHYPVPLHLTEAFAAVCRAQRGSLPIAETLAEEILSLPMYPELTPHQLERTVNALLHFSGSHAQVVTQRRVA